ncbi:hypothetical protein NQZ68_021777 [Dissostichus eleginoides]|nr:hypothetical protein NQZ68_021777 [Dissostichus eleginoides]
MMKRMMRARVQIYSQPPAFMMRDRVELVEEPAQQAHTSAGQEQEVVVWKLNSPRNSAPRLVSSPTRKGDAESGVRGGRRGGNVEVSGLG